MQSDCDVFINCLIATCCSMSCVRNVLSFAHNDFMLCISICAREHSTAAVGSPTYPRRARRCLPHVTLARVYMHIVFFTCQCGSIWLQPLCLAVNIQWPCLCGIHTNLHQACCRRAVSRSRSVPPRRVSRWSSEHGKPCIMFFSCDT